jgi:ABC-2 type transport system permease protein
MHLFLQVLSLESRTTMSYRVDFWLHAVVSFLVNIAIVCFLWIAIFAESGKSVISGWTFEEMVLYYILAILAGKFIRGREQDGTISHDIYEGGLTRYLIFPTSYFPFKYAQNLGALAPALAQLLVFLIIIPVLSKLNLLGAIDPLGLLMAIPSLLVANMLFFLLVLPLQTVAFWADNVWSLSVLMRFVAAFLGGLMLPLNLFPDWAQQILAYTPFPYIYNFPVRLIMGDVSVALWFQGLGSSLLWCVALFAFSRFLWKRGEKVYTGVGI